MKRSFVTLLLLTGSAFPVHAQTLITLDSFNKINGLNPRGALIADAAGDLFGTTNGGGTSDHGTVFEIAKTGSSYGSLTTLATFNNTNGANPGAGLIADAAGNLFGTTVNGGTSNYGTVFEITKTGTTYGALTTLASFNNTNGGNPFAGLMADAAGDLFGTTGGGGTSNYGTVFEIAKTGTAYGSPTTLAAFNNTNGSTPVAVLMADAAGNLFGTTFGDWASNDGTVFEIAKTGTTYGALNTLASFNHTNGADPGAGLITDAAGDLFGTTVNGGTSNDGTVFEIFKTGTTYGALITLATFNNTNGVHPEAGLIADTAGNLFGTTRGGGTSNDGTVYKIAKTGSTYGSPTTLVTFNNTNGFDPQVNLIADAAGNLFGTTSGGGTSGDGTVFEIANSGFVTGQEITDVPEPASVALLGAGILGLAGIRRRSGDRKPVGR